MIAFKSTGGYPALKQFLQENINGPSIGFLKSIADEGLQALSSATPVKTGLTAASWTYKIIQNKNNIEISFYNSNVVNGVNIALIVNYGHGTKNGGYVKGRHYIEPSIRPVFDKLSKKMMERR